jgi:hypothetical protein
MKPREPYEMKIFKTRAMGATTLESTSWPPGNGVSAIHVREKDGYWRPARYVLVGDQSTLLQQPYAVPGVCSVTGVVFA